ncbi:hypothetical protein [Streptomyces sp. NPDC001678]|uniref:hypothetical protein n=1 Tax=Streptomyces sp. NPDC001678 TaxID=3364599 RepID=UPI00369DA977
MRAAAKPQKSADVRAGTPEGTALSVAAGAVPVLQEALKLMRVIGEVRAGGVLNGNGLVHVVLCTRDAYNLARWVRERDVQAVSAGPPAEGSTKGAAAKGVKEGCMNSS